MLGVNFDLKELEKFKGKEERIVRPRQLITPDGGTEMRRLTLLDPVFQDWAWSKGSEDKPKMSYIGSANATMADDASEPGWVNVEGPVRGERA